MTGGVVLAGDRIEAMQREAGAKWPWPGAMNGDARVGLTWPERDPGKVNRRGCFMLTMLDPEGRMVVVRSVQFDTASSHVTGVLMTEGAGMLVQQAVSWGIRIVAVDAWKLDECALWCDMIARDASCRGMRLRFDPVQDMGQALQVYQEMSSAVVWPDAADRERVKLEEAKGRASPELVAAAILAWSYRYQRKARVQPQSRGWERWDR